MLACYRGPPHHKLELHVMQSFFTVLSMWFAMLHCNVGYAGLVKGLVESISGKRRGAFYMVMKFNLL